MCFKIGSVVNVDVRLVIDEGLKVLLRGGVEGVIVDSQDIDVKSAVVVFADYQKNRLELCANPDVVKRASKASKNVDVNKFVENVVQAEVAFTKPEMKFATLCVKNGALSGRLVNVPIEDALESAINKIKIKDVVGGKLFGFILNKRQKRTSEEPRKRTLSEVEESTKAPKRLRTSSQSSDVEDKASKRSRTSSQSSDVEDKTSKKSKKKSGDEDKKTKKAPESDPGWGDDFDPWQQNAPKDVDDKTPEIVKATKKHLSKKEKKALDKLEAEEIAKTEQRILDGEEAKPESAEEFERLLIASPNSSLCYIQYMAFEAQRGGVDKARKVAERALEKINFREEDERLNVYLAWFNLELELKSDKHDDVLAKALKFCDQYKVYDKAALIFEKAGDAKAAEKTLKTMARKFRLEPEVWIKLGLFYFRTENAKEARFTLQRSLQADNLEKKHHVQVTSKFAQMEFKFGDVERGKTVFEKILDNYPNRIDLWSVYVDMLVKVEDVEAARSVLERCIGLGLAPKKMKFFFKKFLEFEEKHGDDQSVNAVRKKALQYVEEKVSD